MATAAQAMSGLDASVPDAMDILSDSGYDFGDGDIDLDLEPVGSVTHDDDLSIHDAGTDNGLDVQTAPADHDDFMADNEDLIEEDVSINNDVNIVSNNQDPLGASMSQQQSLAPPEEDLIDYSDDEGMQHEDQDTNSYHESSRGEQVEHNEEYTIQQSSQHESTDALHVANDYEEKDDNHGYEPEEEDQVEEEQDPNEHDREKLAPALQDQQQAEGADWEQEHLTPVQGYETYEAGDDFNGQITNLQAGNLYDDENAEHQDDEQLMNQVQLNEQADTEEDGQNDQGYICPPVSVGYSGRDFWLFRQHDTENSGEWLLEDMTLAEGELSHVFQACRASIGQDVTVETELGFRFDHMHNMELYEDNTVCAYVTLQRLVDLYHTLLAQDDIAEPEEFYITLLFRPRFFTLLGEMEKYAQEGHGFMKLNADIAAGETHFSNIFSTASTEHGYGEWENNGEGAEEEGEQHGDENQHETQDDLQHNDEHQEEHEMIGDKSREETHEASDEEQKDGTNFARSASQEDELHDTTTSYPETTNITSDTSHSMNNLQGNVESPAQDDNNSRHESASAGESQPDEGEDLIDYSDDDDAGHDEDPENNSRDGASTSSSTVQGEESLDPANMVDAPDSAVQSSHEGNENDDEEDADDEDLSAQYADLDAPDHSYQGQNYGQELYQGEDQAYNSPERLEAYEPNENQEYSAQPDLEGDTNEYYGDHEDQDADEQIFSTLPVDAPDNDTTGAVDSATVDGLIGVEDYMNVGDATLPGLDDDDNILSTFPDDSAEILDPSVEFPDQDGVVEQPAVTVSPVAEPIATSSVEPKGLSPQRQKRTIDEVSNELGEASDSIDAKRPRV